MSKVEIEVTGKAQIAEMQPGDVLLVQVDGKLTPALREQIQRYLKDQLPDGVRTLIGDRTVTFSIVKTGVDWTK